MRKIIAIYEIIAGLGGVLLTLLSLDFNDSIKLSFNIFSLVLFISIFVSGFLLFKGNSFGFYLSIIAQSLQVVNFNLQGWRYEFCSGSKIAINFYNIDIEFAIFLEDIRIGLNSVSESFVAINLIPILVLLLLVIDKKESAK